MIPVKINSEYEQKSIQQYSIDTRDDFLNRIAIELETLTEFLTIEKTSKSEDGSISEVWVKNIASGIFKKRNWEEIERTLDSEAAVSKKEKILLLKFYMFKKADKPIVQNVVKHYYYSIFIKIIGDRGAAASKGGDRGAAAGGDGESPGSIRFDEWYENSIGEIGYILSKRNNYNDKTSKIGFVIDSITTEKIDTELVNINSMTTYKTLHPSLNINLEDICNECIPTIDIPFVSFKNIYKINKNFKEKIDESWQSSGQNEVLFKVLKKYSRKQKKAIFTDTFIRDDPPRIDVDSIFDSGYTDKLKQLRFGQQGGGTELKDIFNFENPITSRYTSSFYILDQTYSSYFILDMIMNDNFFSFFLISNESYIVTRKKNKIFATFRETGPINSRITLNLKTIDSLGSAVDDMDHKVARCSAVDRSAVEEFINKEAVYVKIKSPTIELAEYCKYLITKLFSLYNRKIEEYIGIYTAFNSSFTADRPILGPKEVENIKKEKTLKLKNIEPNIFIKGYGCNNKPIILENYEGATDKTDRISKGELLVFPKESINIVDIGEAGRREGDDEKKEITIVPKIYGCDHLPNTKYPGVKKNVLSNSIYFPFLPCCFTDNQVTKKTSNTYKYIKNIKKKKKKGYQQNVIITKKAMEFKYYGSLDIKLFNICKESENEIYYREGVCENIENSDPDSFIKCMLKATGKSETPAEVRNNIISDERYMAICKQELYDYTDEEIKSILSTGGPRTRGVTSERKLKYIRPQEFCSVMEQYFDCNIFIFSNVINVTNEIKTKVSFAANTKKSPELDLPRNTHSYLRFIREKCVFIYENVGSYSNYFDFPICEIIVRHEYLSKKNFYIFDSESTLGKISTELINSMRSFYCNNIPITSNIKPFSLENIEGQLIDSYGKTRGLLFKKKSIIIPVYTQPLPISFVKPISVDRFTSTPFGGGLSDLKLNNFISSIENILSIKAYIKKGGPLCGPLASSTALWPRSELIKYIQNKKYSNFMKQDIYFNLSHFLNFENPSATSGDRESAALQVAKFFNDVILVDPNVQYTITTNFEKKKRIEVKSDETKKRLLYLTTHEFIHNKEFILNFYKNTKLSIELTIPDMFKTSEFIIFDSFSDILNWDPSAGALEIPKTVSSLSPSLNYPLFYFNKDLGAVPFFVHKPTHNINTLVPDPKTPFLMYCYSNNNNIKLYQINKGKITDSSPNIIAFRFESNIFYMSLKKV